MRVLLGMGARRCARQEAAMSPASVQNDGGEGGFAHRSPAAGRPPRGIPGLRPRKRERLRTIAKLTARTARLAAIANARVSTMVVRRQAPSIAEIKGVATLLRAGYQAAEHLQLELRRAPKDNKRPTAVDIVNPLIDASDQFVGLLMKFAGSVRPGDEAPPAEDVAYHAETWWNQLTPHIKKLGSTEASRLAPIAGWDWPLRHLGLSIDASKFGPAIAQATFISALLKHSGNYAAGVDSLALRTKLARWEKATRVKLMRGLGFTRPTSGALHRQWGQAAKLGVWLEATSRRNRGAFARGEDPKSLPPHPPPTYREPCIQEAAARVNAQLSELAAQDHGLMSKDEVQAAQQLLCEGYKHCHNLPAVQVPELPSVRPTTVVDGTPSLLWRKFVVDTLDTLVNAGCAAGLPIDGWDWVLGHLHQSLRRGELDAAVAQAKVITLWFGMAGKKTLVSPPPVSTASELGGEAKRVKCTSHEVFLRKPRPLLETLRKHQTAYQEMLQRSLGMDTTALHQRLGQAVELEIWIGHWSQLYRSREPAARAACALRGADEQLKKIDALSRRLALSHQATQVKVLETLSERFSSRSSFETFLCHLSERGHNPGNRNIPLAPVRVSNTR